MTPLKIGDLTMLLAPMRETGNGIWQIIAIHRGTIAAVHDNGWPLRSGGVVQDVDRLRGATPEVGAYVAHEASGSVKLGSPPHGEVSCYVLVRTG
jgi:hypothetical protein